jgi:2-keto-3-deoxy-L-rhamnonate aldolase RhmA
VRIPSIQTAGAAATRTRVQEVLALGGDGVVLPHVRSAAEAKEAVSFFRDAKANVWSPANPNGETIAMLMIEDPGALAEAKAIADVGGYSLLACGIGSLRGALGGDAAAAEAGTQAVLAESTRAKLVNMLTANAQDVEKRLKDGFLALLFQGQAADEGIKVGRAAVKR